VENGRDERKEEESMEIGRKEGKKKYSTCPI
jgi:hypothetical protein